MPTALRVLLPAPPTRHHNVKSLEGMRYGLLTVINERGRNGKRMVVWQCQCDCGNTVLRLGSTLINSKSQSCGCAGSQSEARRMAAIRQRKPDAALRYAFNANRQSALTRGLAFELTLTDFSVLALSECAYCGARPSQRKSAARYDPTLVNGIDRVNNDVGYVGGNVAPCCKPCNFMKRAMSRTEFLAHVHRIAKHFERISFMPSRSVAQQKLMQIAEHHPSEVSSQNRGVLKMSHTQLHDFAVGSEKGKPQHVAAPKPAKGSHPGGNLGKFLHPPKKGK